MCCPRCRDQPHRIASGAECKEMMMPYRRSASTVTPVIFAFLLLLVARATADPAAAPNHVLHRALDIHQGRLPRPAHRQRLSSGPLYAVLQASRALAPPALVTAPLIMLPTAAARPHLRTQGCQNVFTSTRHTSTG